MLVRMKRLPLTETDWNRALPARKYFSTLANYKNMVLGLYRDATVAEEDGGEFRAAVYAAHRATAAEVRIVVMTEDWCGDSANVLPYLARLAEAVDVPLRVFRRSDVPELKAWLEDDGTDHIPVVSVVVPENGAARSFVELVRWVERPSSASERYAAWSHEHPELDQLRAERDTSEEADRAYLKVYSRLLRAMGTWYTGGLWRDIGREIASELQRAATEYRSTASRA